MYTRSAVLAPPTYVGLGRFQHGPNVISVHVTSLIKLAVNGMDENEPKGVICVDIPMRCDLEVKVAKAMRDALGWGPDQVIDSDKRNYCSSFQ
jgi:hypothetical protein